MKYIALLRGINVGGNAVIKMAVLKKAVAACGFENVSTYIQSGNVIFESGEKDVRKIIAMLEDFLSRTFHLDLRVVLRTQVQLQKVVSNVPAGWNDRTDLRRYIAFVKEPVTPQDVLREIQLKEGVDSVDIGEGVIYMTTLLSERTNSGFTKLIAKKVYQDITIRNYDTVKKILALIEKNPNSK